MSGEIGVQFALIQPESGSLPLRNRLFHLLELFLSARGGLGGGLNRGRGGLVQDQNQGNKCRQVGGPAQTAKRPDPGTNGLWKSGSRVGGVCGGHGHTSQRLVTLRRDLTCT